MPVLIVAGTPFPLTAGSLRLIAGPAFDVTPGATMPIVLTASHSPVYPAVGDRPTIDLTVDDLGREMESVQVRRSDTQHEPCPPSILQGDGVTWRSQYSAEDSLADGGSLHPLEVVLKASGASVVRPLTTFLVEAKPAIYFDTFTGAMPLSWNSPPSVP